MRGNWDTAEPLVHAPNQQRQQQQQTIVEEQRHPLHSPTTPAWGIADRIVKEEPTEDKNNDSGVSPDHYTSNSASPRSRRSSSTANCSLSPGSATSQDSNNMQCTAFDYSPQGMYKSCGSPLEYAQHHTIGEHQSEQAMDVVSSTVKPAGGDAELVQDALQCPICAFSAVNRIILGIGKSGDVRKLGQDGSGWVREIGVEIGRNCRGKCITCFFMNASVQVQYATCSLNGIRDFSCLFCCFFFNPLKHGGIFFMVFLFSKIPCFKELTLLEIVVQSSLVPRLTLFITRMQVLMHLETMFLCCRLKFTEHLATHCATKCDTQDFVKTVLGQLSGPGALQDENRLSPNQGERSEQESEEADEPGLRVPRVNSQGKVKTFRCKQCNFVAITKLEFWEHSRSHIKAEKLLTCPKCPFVTEYKHHLEYHLRNHFGSKPFKCDKCSYSCVNKSMLNSHLKSHSNIYQYRCANCSYATKYCHSLKLHLRKYSHQPAMVLNADGSPNPLPIIDVYGTRRGPKQKTVKQEDASQNSSLANNNLQTSLPSPQMVVPPQMSPVSHCLPMNPMNGMTSVNGLNGVIQNQPIMAFPYNQIFATFPITHFPVNDDNSVEKQLDRFKSNALMDYMKAIDVEKFKDDSPQDLAVRCLAMNTVANNIYNGLPSSESPKTMDMSPPPLENLSHSMDSRAAPLDLSKPDTNSNIQKVTNSPRATGTSRRKGRAVKLDRRVMEEDTDEELQHSRDEQQDLESSVASPETKPVSERNLGNEFSCQYCDIAFGNVVMYTVHMGYHGYKNPYTCNMCGHECTDKVSFFLHIARSKHS
ncbi:hunchback [Calliopsis andreniformis]|uniref:hunchback n=1 Tax=Calliopsis andreniformis TaxID=337506 RepID=UPI003FCCB091